MVSAVRTSVSKINGEDTEASIVVHPPSVNPRGLREVFVSYSAYPQCYLPTCMATSTFKRLASKKPHIVLVVAWVQTSKAASRLLACGVSELKVLLP
jgi:hypothetical protein